MQLVHHLGGGKPESKRDNRRPRAHNDVDLGVVVVVITERHAQHNPGTTGHRFEAGHESQRASSGDRRREGNGGRPSRHW